MTDNQKTHKSDWLYFLISGAVTVFLLWFYPAWFWLGLPFTLTYLTKALNAL